MIGFLDLQPDNASQPGRCAACNEQKQGIRFEHQNNHYKTDYMHLDLTKCNECSKYICSDCREAHLREASYSVSSLVSQLRRMLPRVSDKITLYEQRVNSVKTHHEQIQREITVAVAALIEELKHRETALFTEAEVYMQSQLRHEK